MTGQIWRGMFVNRFVTLLSVAAVLAASAGALSANALRDPQPPTDSRQQGATTPASVEELGHLLFYDNRLSGDASVSCASCHAPETAWTDGQALSAGYRSTLHFRNTPTILNAGRMERLDWDGRFAAGDMDSLVRDHIAEAHFMNIDGRLLVERMKQTPVYEEAFQRLYGSEVSYGKVLNALSSFVSSRNSVNHPYLRYLEGDESALDSQQQAGLELFQGKAGCAACHSGELLSDGGMHAIGAPDNPEIFSDPLRHITFRRFMRLQGVPEYVSLRSDPGLYAVTNDEADRGKFRTPSLLEAGRTAPYMHNGVFTDLEEVVRFYNDGGGAGENIAPELKPLGLTDTEIESLAAFLSVMGSEEEAVAPSEMPPYELRVLGSN